MSTSFDPSIFYSLGMKALKLDLIAYCSVLLFSPGGANCGEEGYEVKLFKHGLVSSWSIETVMAFQTPTSLLLGHMRTGSSIFFPAQKMLVDSTSEFQELVPVTFTCINRLLGCHKHHWLGEHLLQILDEHLLPKLKINHILGSYFPIFEEISENDKVSLRGLLELLNKFMLFLVEKHGPDTGLKSWYHGSKVLGICRMILIHHHSSSLFTGLSYLLAFTCLYFPDLEVRDNARWRISDSTCEYLFVFLERSSDTC